MGDYENRGPDPQLVGFPYDEGPQYGTPNLISESAICASRKTERRIPTSQADVEYNCSMLAEGAAPCGKFFALYEY